MFHSLIVFFIGLFLSFSQLVYAQSQLQTQPQIYEKSELNFNDFTPFYYSSAGHEHVVQFDAIYITDYSDVEKVKELSLRDRDNLLNYTLKPLLKYLFGPLTYRGWAGVGETISINIDWDKATLLQGKVALPYNYRGIWTVKKEINYLVSENFPVPYNQDILLTPNWKICSDSNPEHQTQSFFWYYWDPNRAGCEHKVGIQFQEVKVRFDATTTQTTKSYPDFNRLINDVDRKNELNITFAFGYIEDPVDPQPETDSDYGVSQYRFFLKRVMQMFPQATVSDIRSKDYKIFTVNDIVVGKKLSFEKSGVRVNIKIVVNAGIDQMVLFAKSFGHDHDSYFAWLGHSRVGSGFDAATFKSMVKNDPEYYSISQSYQLVYWGGCNSYSYYTQPFFKMKAAAFPEIDPKGTRNLDIIANGLPSYFAINSQNAMVQLQGLLNWEHPITYQSWIDQMEAVAKKYGTTVLALVLGDEDNQFNPN